MIMPFVERCKVVRRRRHAGWSETVLEGSPRRDETIQTNAQQRGSRNGGGFLNLSWFGPCHACHLYATLNNRHKNVVVPMHDGRDPRRSPGGFPNRSWYSLCHTCQVPAVTAIRYTSGYINAER